MQHYRDQHERGRIAWAALTGAVVGAGLALCYAPRAGAELRGDMRTSAASMRDAVRERSRRIGQRATSAIECVHGTAGRAVAAMEHGVQHYRAATRQPLRVARPAGE
jgi:gas vesicle protein